MAQTATMSRWNGTICTPEEQALADSGTSLYCLTRGQSIGLAFTAESGFISLVAVLGVFVLVVVNRTPIQDEKNANRNVDA